MHQCNLRIGIKHLDLTRQLGRVYPYIIPGQVGYIWSTTPQKRIKIIIPATEVLFVTRIADYPGVSADIYLAYPTCTVRGAIIGQFYLEREITLLGKNRIQRCSQRVLLVICGNYNRYLRLNLLFPHIKLHTLKNGLSRRATPRPPNAV